MKNVGLRTETHEDGRAFGLKSKKKEYRVGLSYKFARA